MKKYTLILATVAIVLAPAFTYAQSASSSLLNKVRGNIEKKVQNARENEETRQYRLENKMSSTTPPPMMGTSSRLREMGDKAPIDRPTLRNASTTASTTMARFRAEIKDMRREIFDMRKNFVIKQLEQALNNLKQIKDRIATRITKSEANGRNMSSAKTLMMIAETKISLAQDSINTLRAVIASSTANMASSTQIIDTTAAKKATSDAQSAVRSARSALQDVVKAIAQSMGFKIGQGSTATTTATSTATTTP